MRNLVLWLFALCLLISCNESRQYKFNIIEKYPKVIELDGEIIKSINPLQLSDLTVIDTFLIIISKNNNSYIQVYSTVSHDLLAEFSYKGKGPGEFISPSLIPQTNTTKDNLLRVFDAARQSITEIDVHQSIRKSQYIYDRMEVDNVDAYEFYKTVFYYDKGIFFFESGSNDYRISIFNNSQESCIHIPYCFPDPGFPVQKQHQYGLYKSEVIINPIIERIAAAPLLIGQIDFFDFNGNHIISSVFDDDESFESKMNELYRNRDIPDLKWFISDMDSFFDNIYALNLNTLSSRINDLNLSSSEILVFNWDGIPVKRIILDRFVVSIAVDLKHNKIYGYCPYEMDYTIVCYYL